MISLKNTSERYGQVAMFLHWATVLLFFILITLGLWMTALADSDFKWTLYSLHKSFGLLVAGLIILRIYWRATNPVPLLPSKMPIHEQWLAHAVHAGMYAIMLIMPISGFLDSYGGGYKTEFFGLFTVLPKTPPRDKALELLMLDIHRYGAYSFYCLFTLHIIGVIKHHWIEKDNTLRKMLPFEYH